MNLDLGNIAIRFFELPSIVSYGLFYLSPLILAALFFGILEIGDRTVAALRTAYLTPRKVHPIRYAVRKTSVIWKTWNAASMYVFSIAIAISLISGLVFALTHPLGVTLDLIYSGPVAACITALSLMTLAIAMYKEAPKPIFA
jgi:hypothetical protein